MKSTRARQLLSVLRPINRMPKRKQKQFVSCCDKNTIHSICECAKNILVGNVRLRTIQLNKLKKHKTAIRKLVLKKTPLKTKRRLLQKGGFLGALIGPAIGLLSSLFMPK